MIKLAIRRVKPEEEGTLRNWMAELNRRQSEVRATFAREGVRHEQAWLVATSDGPLLVYAMEASDQQQATETFKESTLPIDQQHKEVMLQVLGGKVSAQLLYECMAQGGPK
jgi:hypothetical protein